MRLRRCKLKRLDRALVFAFFPARRKRARGIFGGLLACAAACISISGFAQNAREYRLQIDHAPLPVALRQFSMQTGLQVGRLPDARTDTKARVGPLNGNYTAEAALGKLLANSGLSFKRVNERTIAIVAAASTPLQPNGIGTGEERRKPKDQPYLAKAPSPESRPGNARVEEEIVVTGSRLGRSGEGPAPIMAFDSEMIEEMGVSTVPDVLEYVTQQSYNRPEGYRLNSAQHAEIRGLGFDTTLVLINGRRTVPTATSVAVNAFDLNSIPLPAVERIEVLSDSASAVYGADAVGGVVNIILKKELSGPVVDLKYGAANGGADERRASLSAGYSSERLRTGMVLDYFERDHLLGAERDRWSDQDFRRYGSLDWRVPVANPGTVSSLTPATLPGLPSTFAAVPAGSTGIGLTPADFELTAGQRNQDSLQRFWSIVPATERGSIVASGELDFAQDMTAFGEFLYSDRSTNYQFNPAELAGAIVPATNAFNPFGVPVAVNYLFTGIGPRYATTDEELFRTVGGLRGSFASWDWEFSLLRSEEDGSTSRHNNVNAQAVAAALASSDPERALNVFQDGPGGSRALLESLIAEPHTARYSAEGTQASAFLRGTVLKLPAGPADAVIGAEWRKEDLLIDGDADSFAGGRDVSAAFAELHIPLAGTQVQLPMVNELSLSLAARLDEYSDFGDTFNPQYGIVWRPIADLALRASYGTSFRAPSMFELYMPEQLIPTLFPDPRRHGEIASFTIRAGGNPNLDPTRGDSLTAGIVLTPTAVSQMRIAMNYWRVRLSDQVMGVPLPHVLADEERYVSRVSRAQPTPADLAAGIPGRLTLVDISRANVGTTQTDGVDIEAAYAFDTAIGHFTQRLTATWVNALKTSDSPGAALVDRVGLASIFGTIPRWRAVAAFGWSANALGLSTTLRYVASYEDTVLRVRTGRTIPSQTIVDLQASLALDGLLGEEPFWRGLRLSAGVLNVFDEPAPFSESSYWYGYDLSQGDLRQRFAYIKLSKRF